MNQDEIDALEKGTHRHMNRKLFERLLRFNYTAERVRTQEAAQEIRTIAQTRIATVNRINHGCHHDPRGFNYSRRCFDRQSCSNRRDGFECVPACHPNCLNQPVCGNQVLPNKWTLISQEGKLRIAYPFDIQPGTFLMPVYGVTRRILFDDNGNPLNDFHPLLTYPIEHTPYVMDIEETSNLSRYIRRGCNGNAEIVTVNGDDDMHLFFVSTDYIPAGMTVQWDDISIDILPPHNECFSERCRFPNNEWQPMIDLELDLHPRTEEETERCRQPFDELLEREEADRATNLRSLTPAQLFYLANEETRKYNLRMKELNNLQKERLTMEERVLFKRVRNHDIEQNIAILRTVPPANENAEYEICSPPTEPVQPPRTSTGSQRGSIDDSVAPPSPGAHSTGSGSRAEEEIVDSPKKKTPKKKSIPAKPLIRPSLLDPTIANLASNVSKNLGRTNELGFAAGEPEPRVSPTAEPAPKKSRKKSQQDKTTANEEQAGGVCRRVTRAQAQAELLQLQSKDELVIRKAPLNKAQQKFYAPTDNEQPSTSRQARERQEAEDREKQEKRDAMLRKLRIRPQEKDGDDTKKPKPKSKKQSPRKPGKKSKRQDDDDSSQDSADDNDNDPGFVFIYVPKDPKRNPVLLPGEPRPEGVRPREYNLRWFCKTCEKIFKDRNTVEKHVVWHTGEKKHVCKCGKSFPSITNLNRHIRDVHKKTAQKPCSKKCGYASHIPAHLTRHESTCTGKRKYSPRKGLYDDFVWESDEDIDGAPDKSSSEEESSESDDE